MYHRATIAPHHVEQARTLCAKLRERGVTFDTGYGPDGMDWELDWSIEGHMTAQDILLEIEDSGVDYTITLIPERRRDDDE
tara:strand:+ start:590 stop:832 length:243 start_codon:yes stop_codon:yes gene_type:complete